MICDDFGMHRTYVFLFPLMLLVMIGIGCRAGVRGRERRRVLVLAVRAIWVSRPYLRNCARGE